MLPVAAVHPPVTVVPHLPTLAQAVQWLSTSAKISYFAPESCHCVCNYTDHLIGGCGNSSRYIGDKTTESDRSISRRQ